MVSPEEYETLKKGKPEVKEETNPKLKGPDDVKLKLFYDHQARKAAKQKNREETEAAQLQKRIQPLLALHSGNLAEVLKKFPQDKQAHRRLTFARASQALDPANQASEPARQASEPAR